MRSCHFIMGGEVVYAGLSVDHQPPPPEVGQSFSNADLAKMNEDKSIGLIIHHGEPLPIPGFTWVVSHTELLVLFSHRNYGQNQISLDEVIACLTGHGIDNRPVIRHSGALNQQVLQFVLDKLSSDPLAQRNVYCFGSYRELASACTSIQDALVVGLRGIEAGRPYLEPLQVDGIDPLDPTSRPAYPLRCRVHVYLRNEQPDFLRRCARRYLDAIRQRVAVDHEVLFGRLPLGNLRKSWGIMAQKPLKANISGQSNPRSQLAAF
jgi:hypothetical protein